MQTEWTVEEVPYPDDFLRGPERKRPEIELAWLGQAGFAIRCHGKLFIIDPYLSDSLAGKYKDSLFPHTRLMEIPVPPESIRGVDYVLCSHDHSDHMDADTLKALSENNQVCRFIVPVASLREAVRKGVPGDRIITAGAGREILCSPEMRILGVASSHEELETDERGDHRFLGYVFQLGEVRIYHSGDCIPYDGLVDHLKRLEIHVALLPVNGRDAYRARHGIAGNFTIPEALEICEKAGIRTLLAHHFGMFADNTVEDEALEELKSSGSKSLRILVPEVHNVYRIIQRDE